MIVNFISYFYIVNMIFYILCFYFIVWGEGGFEFMDEDEDEEDGDGVFVVSKKDFGVCWFELLLKSGLVKVCFILCCIFVYGIGRFSVKVCIWFFLVYGKILRIFICYWVFIWYSLDFLLW